MNSPKSQETELLLQLLKQAKEALRESTERYNSFVQHSSEGIWRFETQKPIPINLPVDEQIELMYKHAYLAECNDVMAKMYGYNTAQELLGKWMSELTPKSNPKNVETLRAFIEGGYRIVDAESNEQDADGNPLIFLNNFTGIIEDGHLTRAWGVQRDITKQKQVEASLRESEERYRLAIKSGKVGTWDWDILRNKVTWSEQLFELHQLKPEDFAGTVEAFSEVLHPDDRPLVNELISKAMQTLQPYHAEMRTVRPNGEIRWIYTNGQVFAGSDGNPIRMLGTTIDITERKEMEEAIRKINNNLEELVKERTIQLEQQSNRLRVLADQVVATEQKERKRIAALLHDHLQQILIAMKMQLMEASKKVAKGDVKDTSMHLEKGLTYLNEAVNAARSLTVELRPPVLYEDGLIAAFKWLARKFEAEHGLEIKLDLEETPFSLPDSLNIMIFESVRELLLNVVKHAQTKQATLKFFCINDKLFSLSLEDKGVGFNSNLQTEKTGSMGLFSIHERLKLLNAQFEITSKPGQGTKVEIKIPLQGFIVRKDGEAEIKQLPQLEERSGRRDNQVISILLADDHRLVREGIANILKQNPLCRVIGQAENGLEATEKTALLMPDLVIMDINMPKLNGIEATRIIKRDFPHVQVIGLSVLDELDAVESMKKAGALTLLNKAGDPAQLMETILSCMQHNIRKFA